MSVERAYVAEPVFDQFVDRVVALTEQLRQGVDDDWSMDVGSMTDPRQIDKVQAHVDDAIGKGARVLTGGERRIDGDGIFFKPTVLVDVNEDMLIMNEETFGPVLPIRKVKDAEEALALANASKYGLNASVWSKDRRRALNIARELESGAVCVNDVLMSYGATEAPFGGVKESGIGRRKGPDGIRKYTNQKTVLEDVFGLKREPFWYPYSKKSSRRLTGALRLLFRRGVGSKVAAAKGLLGL
jgi:acyl-CoA reductase-like NAD-dependent aldehyde dehydrogenase